MKRAVLLIGVVAVLASCNSTQAPQAEAPAGAKWTTPPKVLPLPLPDDPMKVTVHRLDNGLTVYLSENHQTPRIVANIVVRAGGARDPRDSTGMAHYLEHLLFKGSRKLGTLNWDAEKPHLERIRALYEKLFSARGEEARQDVFKEIDEANKEASKYAVANEMDRVYKALGFQMVNAFTGDEFTAYTVDLPKNRAEAWAAIESDRFENPVFRLFQSELETVYEEKNSSMDSPEDGLRSAYLKAMFGDHPYATPILGTIEHLKNPSLEKLYAFYDRFYRPENMAIVLAGDFDRAGMLELVSRHFSKWKPGNRTSAATRPLPTLRGVTRVNVQYEAEESIMVGWRLVPHAHPDMDALMLMDMLADNRSAGIINLHLNQQQKVKAAGSYPMFHREAGSWQMWGSPKNGQKLEEVEALLIEVVRKLKKGDFDQSDINAIVTDFEVSQKRSIESNQARAFKILESFSAMEDWRDAASWLTRTRKLTKADVVRVANEYLTDDYVVATRTKGAPDVPRIAKPEFTRIPVSPGRRSKFSEEVLAMRSTPLEAKWVVEGTDYQVREGDWGRMVAARNPIHDLFVLSFRFDRGWRHDIELKYAAALWRLSGAGELSADEFKKKLYGLGSSMDFWCGEWRSGARVTGLEKNYDQTLRLLKLRFASPTFAPDDLQKLIAVELGRRKDNRVNPRSQLNALRQWAMYGRESSVLADLSNEDLARLDAGRLRAMMRGVFDYRAEVAYTGLRDFDEVVASFAVDGRHYKDGFKYRPRLYAEPDEDRILFLHRDMVQSQVGVFTPDEMWDPARWVNYEFYSNYVGGDMSSLLFQEVRESRALAYYVGGSYGGRSWKGDQRIVVGSLDTQADKTVEAARLLRSLLADLPMDSTRFEETTKSIVQKFRTTPLTYSQIPWRILAWERSGIVGGDPRPERMKAAREYDLSEFERFSDRLNGRKWTIYVLGNKDKVDMEALSKLGTVEMIDLDMLFPY